MVRNGQGLELAGGSEVADRAGGEQAPERGDSIRICGAGQHRVVQTALGFLGAVGASPWTLLGHLVQVGERLNQHLGLNVSQTEGADTRGVDDPTGALGHSNR